VTAHRTTDLSWRHRDDRLDLAVGDRAVPVPTLINAYLLGHRDRRVTIHPERDLLADEQELQHHVHRLAGRAASALAQAHECRAATLGAGIGISPSILDAKRVARHHERDAWAAYHRRMFRYLTLAGTLTDLRAWVIDLEVPDGPLAAAAARWQGAPTIPPWLAALESPTGRTAGPPTRAWPGAG
jgi:hypothetical protein